MSTKSSYYFTSESVSDGHPDKIADQISDSILDEVLRADPYGRVACEALVKNNSIILAGEITTNAHNINFEKVIRDVIKNIGYDDPTIGFDYQSAEIISFLSEQSPDIALGVDEDTSECNEQGAGDQGLMFGYACDETETLMPMPIYLAHRLMENISNNRKSDPNSFLKPDAKSQVTVKYENGQPIEVDTVVLSTQHSPDVDLKVVREFVIEEIIKKTIPEKILSPNVKYLINPTGRFIIGGPVGDCGLTGRKIIVDTYGGYSRHGGGAFSGKDPSKVDRSAAYATRHIAKNVVAAGLARKCEVQLAYAIGIAEPVSIYVDTFGTGVISDTDISKAITKVFKVTPKGMIKSLELLKPIYRPTSTFGHFGRPSQQSNGFFSWEKTDKIEDLKSQF
jgi:S-adenosylmethionine synthetase